MLEEGLTSAQWTGGHPFRSRSTDPFSSVEQFNFTTGPALLTIGNHSLCFYGEINNGSHRLFHSVTVSLEAQNWNKLESAGQESSGTLQSQSVPITDAFSKPLECVSVTTSFSVHCLRLLYKGQRFVDCHWQNATNGFWKAESSVARYEKSSRMTAVYPALLRATRRQLRDLAQSVEAIILG